MDFQPALEKEFKRRKRKPTAFHVSAVPLFLLFPFSGFRFSLSAFRFSDAAFLNGLEAGAGIEPTYRPLQGRALALGYPASKMIGH